MDAPDLGPRYQPLYRLAAGGMAEVWVGAQKVAAAQRPVAIKRILPQFAEEEKYVRMFLDEAHLAACIDSPNVVALIDADIATDGAPYLVMELVEGLPLSTMLRAKPPMDHGTVCYVIKEAALGLHDAHEARAATGELLQLVHRDVSPQNLLVGVDGRVRLADFGVAHALERMTLTVGGEFKGKLAYCAPEQLHGKADRRADIFSLGVVIRQALSGEKLFGKSSGNAETLRKLLHEEILPTRTVAPHVDPALAEVIDKALCRDPNARYSTAAAFADALTPFVDASRVSLGQLVEVVGGMELQKRRDKTTEMFTALKAGSPPPSLTDPANSLVALSPTAQTPVPVAAPAAASAAMAPTSSPARLRAPKPKARIWPVALVMAGAATFGVTVALSVDDDPIGDALNSTDFGQSEDLLPDETAPVLPVLPNPPQAQEIAEPLIETGEAGETRETGANEPADSAPTIDEPSDAPRNHERRRQANSPMTSPSMDTTATNTAATNTAAMDTAATNTAAMEAEPVTMSASNMTTSEDETNGDSEEPGTSMGRASRLRRDVF